MTRPTGAAFGPHVMGIDDGPFDKRADARVPVVGVMMEGAGLVEAVALTEFPLDGDGATEFLATWIGTLRCAATLHGVILGGVTIAGLGIVDVAELARRLGRPVLVVNRKSPANEPLALALGAAGLEARIPLLARLPPARRTASGLYLAHAGVEPAEAERLLSATLYKALVPEPLRVAHLVAAAIARGESRGRV
jgi:hypothetical protein